MNCLQCHDSAFCTIYKIVVLFLLGGNMSCVQDPKIRPLAEEDSITLQRLLPEIPLWVKNPDFDRVCYSLL